jgi:hypothetical protein
LLAKVSGALCAGLCHFPPVLPLLGRVLYCALLRAALRCFAAALRLHGQYWWMTCGKWRRERQRLQQWSQVGGIGDAPKADPAAEEVPDAVATRTAVESLVTNQRALMAAVVDIGTAVRALQQAPRRVASPSSPSRTPSSATLTVRGAQPGNGFGGVGGGVGGGENGGASGGATPSLRRRASRAPAAGASEGGTSGGKPRPASRGVASSAQSGPHRDGSNGPWADGEPGGLQVQPGDVELTAYPVPGAVAGGGAEAVDVISPLQPPPPPGPHPSDREAHDHAAHGEHDQTPLVLPA